LTVLFIATLGCKHVTNSTEDASPLTPHFSAYTPLQVHLNKSDIPRKIIFTNAFVLETNRNQATISPSGARDYPTLAPTNFVFLPTRYYTPTNLAIQIATADHIVVENCFTLDAPPSKVTLLISGDAARQAVHAVSQARRYIPQANPGWIPNWELQFYRGTTRLASIRAIAYGFDYDNETYTDETGVVVKICAMAEQESGFTP